MPNHLGRSASQLVWTVVPVVLLLIPASWALLRFSAAHARLGTWTLTIRDSTGAVMGTGTTHWVAASWGWQVEAHAPFVTFSPYVTDNGTVTWTATGAAALRAAGRDGEPCDISNFGMDEDQVYLVLFPDGEQQQVMKSWSLDTNLTGDNHSLAGPMLFRGFPHLDATDRSTLLMWTLTLTR